MKSIYWVRNDLRWLDNKTLLSFCSQASTGVFIWCETDSFRRATAFRRKFIIDSVIAFKNKIESSGGTFIITDHKSVDFIPQFVVKHQIEGVFYTSECATEEIAEQNGIDHLPVKIFKCDQASLIHASDLPMTIANLPEQFTSFRKKIEQDLKIHLPLAGPQRIPAWPEEFPEGTLRYRIETEDQKYIHPEIHGGEQNGLDRLKEYVWDQDRLKIYKETRNGMLEWNDSSKLSPWLSVGALSPRTIYQNIKKYETEVAKNDSTYWLFFELLWRDYFRFISLKWGSRLFTDMHAKKKPNGIILKEKRQFELWASAQSGDDFVDANMQELNQTGWMSNRGRQNVASYLAKTMQVNWVWGAEYFEQKLIDYDASSNRGNWAYLAGVGQDSRDRSFNTQRQAAMYDAGGEYRRKWLVDS
ncbi:MAG: DASH family cryptochrome [Bdellovibrio sp.]|nr:DASH family cryptochrome [Bdellovibrio sp.]